MRNKIIEKHFRENYTRNVKRINSRIGHWHTAEDVVTEAYTRALKYFRTFDPTIKEFDAWFNTILNNSLKKIKKEERDRGIYRPVDEEVDGYPILKSDSLSKEVIGAIKTMEDCREKDILMMYYIQGFKTRDISEYLSLGHSNVRMILLRYRTRLEEEYG